MASDNGGSSANDKGASQDVVSGRRIHADWVLGIGEPVQQLEVIDSTQRDVPSTIMLLGAKTLIGIYDTGVIIFMKKLEFHPIAMLTYPSGE